jgi:FMN phosphatase YigB (HAD superfamily)
VMVGDSYAHDIEGALAVGMRGILLRRAARVPGGPAEPGATPHDAVHVISTLSELPALL